MYSLKTLQVAIQLTGKGLKNGREYSHSGIKLHTKYLPNNKEIFIISYNNKNNYFNNPFEAAKIFTLLINNLI